VRYLVVIEKAGRNWSAYSPDVPGCVATGRTSQEARRNWEEALKLHLEGLREDGLPWPEPIAHAEYVEAPVG
jgi:predicted RNase H-like HicB family nuclease